MPCALTLKRSAMMIAASMMLLSGCVRGPVVGVCPEYPDTPDSVLDTLAAQAKTDAPTGQYLIDQSQLADQLDACHRTGRALDLALQRPE